MLVWFVWAERHSQTSHGTKKIHLASKGNDRKADAKIKNLSINYWAKTQINYKKEIRFLYYNVRHVPLIS
ncbi:MAG TPA: hypothetical protein DCE42_03885 [Myxococcales bacterium]|nr:hypothetical protein [Deltaproteobacteria bacterium]MBU48541.1 hypothetical protein [Deltaproteobacteria bacterium]HAA53866.1 hypothetical protein [Myxococcales bacterium]